MKKTKTFAYYRNSITKEKQPISIEMQMDHVRKLAKHQKIIIDDEFIDSETSARKTQTEERPQMMRLLNEVSKGSVNRIIVYSRCRIARNVAQYMKIYNQLKQHEVEVLFAADFEFPLFYTAEGEMIERIMGAFNQQDAENLVKKLQDAKKTRARSGKHAAGAVNYGYRPHEDVKKHKGDWVKHPEEAVAIKNLYESYLSFEFKNNSEFIKMLNENSVNKADGEPWNYKAINLLSKKVYKGTRSYSTKGEKTIIKQVSDLIIVNEETWEKVQEKMKLFKRAPREKQPIEEETNFILEGLINCEKCGNQVKGNFLKRTDNVIPVYRCGKDSKVQIDKEFFESEVIKLANKFFSVFLAPNIHQFLMKWIKDTSQNYSKILRPLTQKKESIEKRIVIQSHTLMEKGFSGKIPFQIEQDYLDLDEINQQIERFEIKEIEVKEKARLIQELYELYKGDMDNVIDQFLDEELQRELLHDVIREICVDEKEAVVIFQHPFYEPLGGREVIELI
jgi:site-specific DNA recombinase